MEGSVPRSRGKRIEKFMQNGVLLLKNLHLITHQYNLYACPMNRTKKNLLSNSLS
jgi:hypothetical protein